MRKNEPERIRTCSLNPKIRRSNELRRLTAAGVCWQAPQVALPETGNRDPVYPNHYLVLPLNQKIRFKLKILFNR